MNKIKLHRNIAITSLIFISIALLLLLTSCNKSNAITQTKVVIIGSYKQCWGEMMEAVKEFESNGCKVLAPIKSTKAGDGKADFVVLKADLSLVKKKLGLDKISDAELDKQIKNWQTGKKHIFTNSQQSQLESVSKDLQDAVNNKIEGLDSENGDFVYVLNERFCNKKDLGEFWTGHSTDMEFGYALAKNKKVIFANKPETLNHRLYADWGLPIKSLCN